MHFGQFRHTSYTYSVGSYLTTVFNTYFTPLLYYTQFEETPVSHASRNGYADVVQVLISASADINVTNMVKFDLVALLICISLSCHL